VIILELELVSGIDVDGIWFHGTGYADGFRLVLPTKEWKAMGSPDKVQFIVSTERLGVSLSGWVRA
jgi:hypothetical protein